MILTENFNIKNGTIKGLKIAYIDPETSENTYAHKDVIKDRFHGKWLKVLKTWGWFLGDNPENVYRTQIKPCLEYLESVARVGNRRDSDEIISQIDALIHELESRPEQQETTDNGGSMEKNEIINKLDELKQQLINCTSSEDFRRIIEPIIKFKRAQGHQFSLINCMLIRVQDPEATLVKSKYNWEQMNRRLIPGTPRIKCWVPIGQRAEINKEEVTAEYLASLGKEDVSQLNHGEREELRIRLRPVKSPTYDLLPRFADYRFTEQIEGTEDVVGDPYAEVPNTVDNGEETDESFKYIEAMKRLIEKSGIRISYVDNNFDNGDLGRSFGGEIKISNNARKNMGYLSNLIRQFAHEVLHQKYLNKRGQRWAQYFIGTRDGMEKINQQASLTAWIVLQLLGYDVKVEVNYAGLWGMSNDNVKNVFDTVAVLANDIHKNLRKEAEKGNNDYGMTAANDSYDDLSEEIVKGKTVTGRDIAKMLGMVDIYDKCNPELEQVKENFNKMFDRINNPINY